MCIPQGPLYQTFFQYLGGSHAAVIAPATVPPSRRRSWWHWSWWCWDLTWSWCHGKAWCWGLHRFGVGDATIRNGDGMVFQRWSIIPYDSNLFFLGKWPIASNSNIANAWVLSIFASTAYQLARTWHHTKHQTQTGFDWRITLVYPYHGNTLRDNGLEESRKKNKF